MYIRRFRISSEKQSAVFLLTSLDNYSLQKHAHAICREFFQQQKLNNSSEEKKIILIFLLKILIVGTR